MPNTLINPTMITREAQRILHQSLNFVGNIDRQYDKRFAQTGAKIGTSLQIREPNQFAVRTGKTLDVQDVTETYQTLNVATQVGVDMSFSTAELTMNIDDFSKRYIEPAVKKLAAHIENDAMSMYADVNQSIWGATASYADILTGRAKLNNSLAPMSPRIANLNSQDTVDIVSDVSDLFNKQEAIGKQYTEGYLGRVAGFDFVENTLWSNHTTANEDGNYVCNTSTGITSGSASIALTAGANGLNAGDVFTIGGVFRVHPESKVSTGALQEFVVTADYTSGSVSVYPTPVTSGAKQNVSIVSAGSGKTVTVSGTANTAYTTSMLFHPEAFTFVTADLEMPGEVSFKDRRTVDGISMRIIRQYDINNDSLPCRLDVYYGYKTIRPELACRLHYTA